MNSKESWSRIVVFSVFCIAMSALGTHALSGSIGTFIFIAVAISLSYSLGAFQMVHSYKKQVQEALLEFTKNKQE